MYTKKELKAMSNRQLLRALEGACYAVCHKDTKTNCINLDRVHDELLERLERGGKLE